VSHILSGHQVRSIRDLGGDDDVEARVDRAQSIAWMFVHRTGWIAHLLADHITCPSMAKRMRRPSARCSTTT
jgi:hypothetical protein